MEIQYVARGTWPRRGVSLQAIAKARCVITFMILTISLGDTNNQTEMVVTNKSHAFQENTYETEPCVLPCKQAFN